MIGSNRHGPGTWVFQAATWLLETEDIERCIEPAVGDLQHEQPAAGRRAWEVRWAPTLRLLFMLAWLFVRARIRRTPQTRWYALAPAVLAVFIGMSIVRGAGVSGDVARLQAGWLLVGLLAAWLIATSPRSLLERTSVALGILSVVALAVTAWLGVSQGSASRWLAMGPIRIQTSTLLLPCIVVAVSTLSARGSLVKALAMAGAAQLALVLQPDGPTSVALTIAALAGVLGAGSGRVPHLLGIGGVLGIGSALAMVRDPNLNPVGFVEGVFDLPGVFPLKVAGLVALALVPAYPAIRAFRVPPGDVMARSVALAMATTLAALMAMPLFGPAPVPLVGYGGSSVVSCLIGLAFVLALETDGRRAPPEAAPLTPPWP